MLSNKLKIAAAMALTFSCCIGLPLKPMAQVKKNKKSVVNNLLPFDPAVKTGKLPNGFTYYIRHNEEPKNRVVLYLANKVGSILEDEDQRGLAHFMEHMSFNGTTHYPHNELINYLQKNGVRFGADINAYTSFDETVYQLPLPTDNPEVMRNGIQIMRDWAQEALLDPTEIDKERGVVLEEKRLGKGAQERMQRQYFPTLLNNSRYGLRIPIGIDTVLDNFKPATIKRFYHDWYRPDLQALIVVGDINVDSMERVVKLKFSDLKNPVHEKSREKYTIPLTGENKFIAVTDPEMTATVAEVTIKQPELEIHTAVDYRKALIRALYNSMIGKRYDDLLRNANPPFMQGGADISGFMGGLDAFDANVVAKPGELESGFKAVWREIERTRKFGFTITEFERAKLSYISNFEAAVKEKDKTKSENYVQEYLGYFLHGTASPGISYEYQLVKNDLSGITLAELNTLAKTAVKNTDRTILIMAPGKDKGNLPDEATVKSWLNAVQAEQLAPYVDQVTSQPLLSIQPIAGKIINETKDAGVNTTTITLSNGVKVVLKPTTYKQNQILFKSFSPGGTSLYNDNDFQSAANAGIIASFGVGNYSPEQLDKFLSDKQVGVQPYIGERMQGVEGVTEPKDLETALQLVYAYYTEPRKDSSLFKGIIVQAKAGLVNRENDPKSVFQDTVRATLSNYSIRRTGPSIAKIDQINLDRSYEIYKERFGNAAGTTFTFVGSIDTTLIKPLIEKYLGGLPATGQQAEDKDLGIHIPSGKIVKTVYKGSEPKATVELLWSGTFDFNAINNLGLKALKECLQIRLLERLREDESGVYSPSASIQISKNPQNRYALIVQFGCAPQNVEKLIASVMDEVTNLRADGPLQVNLDKFKTEDQRIKETQLNTNGFWLDYLTGQLEDNEDTGQINQYPIELKAITIASVKELAVKYLDGKNFVRLVLMPDNKVTN